MGKTTRGLKPRIATKPHKKEVICMGNYNTKISPEEYVILTFLTAPGEYIEQLLKTSPEIFPSYNDIFQRLQNALRIGGEEKIKSEAVDILSTDERAKRLLSLNRGFFPSLLELEANIRELEKLYEQRALEKFMDEFRHGKISLDEFADRTKEIHLKLSGKKWKFTLSEEKDELLEEDDEETITLPFIGVETYPSDIVLITAKTKSGKTTLAMNMILSFIKSEEIFDPESPDQTFSRKALYVTYEVPKKKLFRMLVGIDSGKSWKEVSQEDKEKFLEKYGENLSIKEGPQLEDLIDFLWLFQPDVFIIDYDQLIPTKGKFESEERRVAHIIRSLKDVAMQIGSVGIVLSQVNEDGKARYSREKEHAASIHIHLEKQDSSDTIEYEVRLNRWGKSDIKGSLKVDWNTRRILKSQKSFLKT